MGLKILTTPKYEGGTVPDYLDYIGRYISGSMLLVEAVLLEGDDAPAGARSGASWLTHDVCAIAKAVAAAGARSADGRLEWDEFAAALDADPLDRNFDLLADMTALLTVEPQVECQTIEDTKHAIAARLRQEIEKLGRAA